MSTCCWEVEYPIMYRVFNIPGGAGFFPSTYQQYYICLMFPQYKKARCAWLPCYMQLMHPLAIMNDTIGIRKRRRIWGIKSSTRSSTIATSIYLNRPGNDLTVKDTWIWQEDDVDRRCVFHLGVSQGAVKTPVDFWFKTVSRPLLFNERWQKLTGCSMVVSVRDWPSCSLEIMTK